MCMNKDQIISDLSKATEQLKDKPIEGSLIVLSDKEVCSTVFNGLWTDRALLGLIVHIRNNMENRDIVEIEVNGKYLDF